MPFFLPAAAATGCPLCVRSLSPLEHMINILTGSAERTLRAGAAGLQGRPGGPCEGRTVSPGGVAQQHTPAAWAPQSHVEHFHSMQKRFCGRSTAAAGRRACRRRGRPRARAGACSAGAGARSRTLPAQGLPADTACEDPGACRCVYDRKCTLSCAILRYLMPCPPMTCAVRCLTCRRCHIGERGAH